jgi:hypothetical protein
MFEAYATLSASCPELARGVSSPAYHYTGVQSGYAGVLAIMEHHGGRRSGLSASYRGEIRHTISLVHEEERGSITNMEVAGKREVIAASDSTLTLYYVLGHELYERSRPWTAQFIWAREIRMPPQSVMEVHGTKPGEIVPRQCWLVLTFQQHSMPV